MRKLLPTPGVIFRALLTHSFWVEVFTSWSLLLCAKLPVSHILRFKRALMGNSVDIAPLAPAGEGRLSPGLLGFQGVSVILLVAWLYHSILYRLAVQWIGDPNFSHGVFVPAFSLFVLWQDRRKLKTMEPAPSWSGLPLVILSLLMLVLGVLGVELFTSRLSLLILIAGLIIL